MKEQLIFRHVVGSINTVPILLLSIGSISASLLYIKPNHVTAILTFPIIHSERAL